MTAQAPLAIEATGLAKSFGATRAVDGIDLAVPGGRHLRRARAQRRGQDHGDPDAGHPHPSDGGSARVLGHDVVTEGDAVRSAVSLTGQLASVDEDLTGRENLILLGRLLGPDPGRRADAGRRAAGGLRHRRGREPAGQALLRRHAAAARHRGQHRRHPAGDVPRRADHRPRPALAQPGLGDRPGAGGRGDDDPALHAVPRGGRPARRRHRRHRPRPGHRRGDAGPAQGLGRRRCAARAAARRRPAGRGGRRAGAGRGPRRARPRPGGVVGRVLRPRNGRPPAVAELARTGIGIAEFSLAQPSLDEVFLALTGHIADEQRPASSRRRRHDHHDPGRRAPPTPPRSGARSPRRTGPPRPGAG